MLLMSSREVQHEALCFTIIKNHLRVFDRFILAMPFKITCFKSFEHNQVSSGLRKTS